MPTRSQTPPATLQDALDAYIAGTERTASPQLTTAYQQALKLFIDVLETEQGIKATTTPVTALRVGWAEDYLNYLQQHRAVETEHLYSRAILDFYAEVEGNGWAEVDTEALSRLLQEKRRPKQHRIPDPPTEAIDRIIDYATATPVPAGEHVHERDRLRLLRDKAFVLVLADTGLKVSEMCDLRRSQLGAELRTLQIDGTTLSLATRTRRAIQRYLTAREKLDSQQTATTNQETLPIFARHDKRASNAVLPISRWTAANIVDEWVRLALPTEERHQLEASGQAISPQTFRHYFVLTTLEHTGDVSQTQALARHTDRSTTRRYMHTLKSGEAQADEPTTE